MASNRFGSSSLHQRDPRSALFEKYTGDKKARLSPPPQRPAGGYGYAPDRNAAGPSTFRPATPNSRGQYSEAVLSELESQNDTQLEGMGAKVKMLKDITVAIGDEIRSSSTLAESMNDSFDNTRRRLLGTMNRMLRMAERTGVGWRVWLGFFAAVSFLFWYVWLF